MKILIEQAERPGQRPSEYQLKTEETTRQC